ncbi:MAG: hypothetical protein ACYC5R_06570 [Melioribacteraceae bacterium]
MVVRKKLEIEPNSSIDVQLIFDSPIEGHNDYGPYFMYALKIEGDDGFNEVSYFAPPEVNVELSKLHKGDVATISRLVSRRNNKLISVYEVKAKKAVVVDIKEEKENGSHDILDPNDSPVHDTFFGIMKQSYLDALEISRELNGMASAEKIAVTLFIARSKNNNY